jgi:hypothetical protein
LDWAVDHSQNELRNDDDAAADDDDDEVAQFVNHR